jgi:hypothetical protein
MRTSRSPAGTADFENLLTTSGSTDGATGETIRLPDPFSDVSPELPRPVEDRAPESNPFPDRPRGPYRPYWRESTFLRAVGLGFAPCLAAVHEWGQRAGEPGVIEVGRGQLEVASDLGRQPGRCALRARLHRGSVWSFAVPMELELIPWPEVFATTWLALCPRRRVHLSGRYFRAGHALLDQVSAGLLLLAGGTPQPHREQSRQVGGPGRPGGGPA